MGAGLKLGADSLGGGTTSEEMESSCCCLLLVVGGLANFSVLVELLGAALGLPVLEKCSPKWIWAAALTPDLMAVSIQPCGFSVCSPQK